MRFSISKILGFLVLSILVSSFVYAATLCSFKGPDTSADQLQLGEFFIIGNSPLEEGEKISGEFKLKYVGKASITFDSKYGIFIKAKDPDGVIRYFGTSNQGKTLKNGETVSLSTPIILDKPGKWQIWASYCIKVENGIKCGPDGWQLCTLKVNEIVKDTDQDGISDNQDNCPTKSNPKQEDTDKDGIGDACDSCDDRDSDGDGIKNCQDKCINEKETFNKYLDNDGCPDKVEVETSDGKLNLEVIPSSPKKGEKFTIKVTSDSQTLKTIEILIDDQSVQKCLKSPCEYSGIAMAEMMDMGAASTDTEGLLTTVGSVLWRVFPEPSACSDSDNGIYTGEPGRVINESGYEEDGVIHFPPMYYDECLEEDLIREYYCDGDERRYVDLPCPFCVDEEEMVLASGGTLRRGDWCQCSDTDRGRNYFERGRTTTDEGLTEDYCLSDDKLVEFYCDEKREPQNVTVDCEFHRLTSAGSYYFYDDYVGCSDGACPCDDTDGGINFDEKGYIHSETNSWYEDECVVGGIHEGELKEYYLNLTVERFDETGNPVYMCTVYDILHTCKGECDNGRCVPTCFDGEMNQGEEDIDCGGPCSPCLPHVFPCIIPSSRMPDAFDWRDYNILPEIRNQAACGSCWAFSAIGAVEGKYNIERIRDSIRPDPTVNLSEQYFVSDCMDGCCEGGWHNDALNYIKNNGVPDEDCLPYQSGACLNTSADPSYCFATCNCGRGQCSSPCSCNSRCWNWNSRLWDIDRYERVSDNHDDIKNALICHGPLAVASDNWNHAILLVGFNDTTRNWTIRNSWGGGWGNRGYGEIPYTGHLYSDIDERVYYVKGVNPP